MTEEEWLAECLGPQALARPENMLGVIQDKTTTRKCQCYALACLQVILPFLREPSVIKTVNELDRIVAGKGGPEELLALRRDVLAYLRDLENDPSEQKWFYISAYSAEAVASAVHIRLRDNISKVGLGCRNVLEVMAGGNGEQRVNMLERSRQAGLIREVFGNPFRPVTLDPSWLTTTVVALANGIYNEKAFDRMPILADALQDAGCDNEDILNHCRQSGEHVRGCWVVDLLLGKK